MSVCKGCGVEEGKPHRVGCLLLKTARFNDPKPNQKPREWNLWEKRVESEANLQRLYVAQLPVEVRKFHSTKPIKVKSKPDFVVAGTPGTMFFDAKVTNDRLWNLNKYVFHEKKIHQYAELMKAWKDGNHAGYLIWFVDYKKIVWLPVELVQHLQHAGTATVHPETIGVFVQDDDQLIDFRGILKHEIQKNSEP